ncbi:aldehyde dehydrogenase family protein [Paenarthrobacter sp. Z7-10]|uniref:aldehyde dehydrogenase family protein n=1 Tax=Paenarthrobacter sp. Z7-10 TaxID=2787635 RepID=UPI0022A99216|nr:aldehyde dehydrogenase family protein [Paenarthrobacter sp. Z7-10]MCZ2404907.1 aldehyde dehydrogenase family protein [Paenarthrobacter sp. Z7-10]
MNVLNLTDIRTSLVRGLFLNGDWSASSAGVTRVIHCPADGTRVADVTEGTAADARAAVASARQAFDDGTWPGLPEIERGQVLLRVADLLGRDKAAYARAEALDTGKRYIEAEYDIQDVISCFRYYGGLAGTDSGRVIDTGQPDAISKVVHAPVGVCALITPWNYPLLQASWKVAPALLAGNTFVLKPSELTPSTSILLMETLREAGVPAGAANLVTGPGPDVGAVLSSDPGVDLVSFTGGLATGKLIMAAAAATVKRVALELGGKNPNIVFADADRESAIDNALTAIFLHSGQVCSAGARLIVQDSIHDDFVAELARRAKDIRLGGPFDDDAETGPLISSGHRDKVHAYVQTGVTEGARLLCGGFIPDAGSLAAGSFYPPTILDGCHAGMRVVAEESFGPVLTVETFSTEQEAVRLANDTSYGLAGAVWTENASRAQRVARDLRHGTVWINDYHPYVPQAEWGGFGQSGNGRELGLAGLAEYRETKHIWQNINPGPSHWFGPSTAGAQQ